MRIYDVTVPIRAEMPVYPGDAPVQIIPVARFSKGDIAEVSELRLGTHTGTHVDPPGHFVPGGAMADRLPLEVMLGECLVVDARGVTGAISVAFLEGAGIPAGAQRLLFLTSNSALWASPEFARDFVYIAPDAARWLVERGVRLVGVDYLSVEQFGFDRPDTHTTLLGAGVVVIEGLNLTEVPPGAYTLLCLPLRLADGDGAPARVVLVEGQL
ncbi:MAG: cyclase family protein [Chloroflexi bacterium]|nr:cyclase family protein [Chloroflexota bacterium]